MDTPRQPELNCPKCGSESVAQFLYGFARMSAELKQQIAEGKIVLGGGCLSPKAPKWRCNACRQEWGNPVVTIIERDTPEGPLGQIRVD